MPTLSFSKAAQAADEGLGIVATGLGHAELFGPFAREVHPGRDELKAVTAGQRAIGVEAEVELDACASWQ